MQLRRAASKQSMYLLLLGLLFWGFTPLNAKPDKNKQQIMGKVTACRTSYIKVGKMSFYLTPSTRVYSQSREKISISKICQGGLVNVSFKKRGSRLIAKKIKLLDLAGKGRHSKFSGKIYYAGKNTFKLGDRTFEFDEFTIRLGDTVQRDNTRKWLGANVTVIALQRESGLWNAEVIREGLDITAMAN